MSNWHAVIESTGAGESTTQEVKAYLEHYGYLAGNILAGSLSESQTVALFAQALSELQSAGGLPPTGFLDEPTRELIARKRCGCLDVVHCAPLNVLEAKWRKNKLTYAVQGYVSGLPQSEQDDIIEFAWQQWENVANFTIERIAAGTPDIIISVGRGRAQGFDGPSGTLAWAYLPTGSDSQLLMRFDLDETWVKTGSGIRLLNVATHEFGHLLGLDHSRVNSALMAPFYNEMVSAPQQADDIPRIQSLYGAAGAQPPPVPPTAPPPPSGRKVIMFEIDGKITKIMADGFNCIPK